MKTPFMELMNWYEVVRDFQTLLVGACGFAGVILTLVVNARIDRAAEREAIRQRKMSVISAVTAEISLYQKLFRRIIDHAKEVDGGLVVPRMRMRHFEAVSNEIGLLGRDLSGDVLNAILAIEEINSIFAMEGEESTEYNFSISRDTMELAISRMERNEDVLTTALTELEKAHSANA